MDYITFILTATLMTLLCLSLQAIVGVYAVHLFRVYASKQSVAQSLIQSFTAIALVMLLLMLGNLLQIIAWAYLYIYLGEFQTFKDAFYFSGVTFTSLGYGDIILSEVHRGLSPIQAANGLMMFGVSTAILFAVIQNHKHLKA